LLLFTYEVLVRVSTARPSGMRRMLASSILLLAVASIAAACANPTGPSNLNNTPSHAGSVTGSSSAQGVTAGSSG
jgi:hypothetical protein